MSDGNESKVSEYAAGLARIKQMTFGCIVENIYASEDNPHRMAIFVRAKTSRGRTVAICTDGRGEFWAGGIERLFLRETPSEKADRLQAFKEYVHQRLDDAGIPTHPEGKHSAAGCRIGDRIDILLANLAHYRAQLDEAIGCVEAASEMEGYVAGSSSS